ncbi:putative signal peptide protein [Candidatus Burkholderia crenata]|nr:putative signal peptide protein [Candidatus Burkholderia crenata]
MNKLLIASVVGALSLSGMLASTSALAADATTTTTTPAKSTTAKKAVAKRPAPARRLIKRKPAAEAKAAAKVDPIPDGVTKWSCNEGLAFYLKGDMKRDQVVTVNWAKKDYQLPREATNTGADRFHDAASGMALVVIPTKAMLFSDKDSSRLADECKTDEMAAAGTPAPTQSNALVKNVK